jgi:hypothetical protein
MADKKISALTASTTPLAGTEVLPIVQSGATVKVAVSDLTAGRAISATQLTLTTGNVIVASGQGIDFSATPGTGTSELLADYEEGTWTPALSASGATFGYEAQLGRYTKIGNVVVVQGRIALNSASGGSGAVTLTGLPFTSAAALSFYAVGQQGIIGRAASFAGDTPSTLEVNSSSTTANMYYRAASNSGSVQLDYSDVGSSADFLFTIVYQAS